MTTKYYFDTRQESLPLQPSTHNDANIAHVQRRRRRQRSSVALQRIVHGDVDDALGRSHVATIVNVHGQRANVGATSFQCLHTYKRTFFIIPNNHFRLRDLICFDLGNDCAERTILLAQLRRVDGKRLWLGNVEIAQLLFLRAFGAARTARQRVATSTTTSVSVGRVVGHLGWRRNDDGRRIRRRRRR